MIWQIRFVTFAGSAPVLSPSVTLPWSAKDVTTNWTEWSTIFTLMDGGFTEAYRLEARTSQEGPGKFQMKMSPGLSIQVLKGLMAMLQTGTPPNPPQNPLEGQQPLKGLVRHQDKV